MKFWQFTAIMWFCAFCYSVEFLHRLFTGEGLF